MNNLQTAAQTEIRTVTVLCPISGKATDPDPAKDAVFAQGKGCAIKPYEGHLYAPFSGKVVDLSDTLHALSLVSDDGVELLIRIGRDTAELGGKYFSAYCKAGDSVKEGELLIDFDLDSIEKDGYDTLTPVIVTNCNRYESIQIAAQGKTGVGDTLLNLIEKPTDSDQETK